MARSGSGGGLLGRHVKRSRGPMSMSLQPGEKKREEEKEDDVGRGLDLLLATSLHVAVL